MFMVKYTVVLALVMVCISCSNQASNFESNYKRNTKEYNELRDHFFNSQNSSCDVISFRKRRDLKQIEIHIVDSVSNFIRTVYYNIPQKNFEDNMKLSCGYSIDSILQFIQKTNCNVIEWNKGSLFVGLGGRVKSKNPEHESGILIYKKGTTQLIGKNMKEINDTVCLYEKRVF